MNPAPPVIKICLLMSVRSLSNAGNVAEVCRCNNGYGSLFRVTIKPVPKKYCASSEEIGHRMVGFTKRKNSFYWCKEFDRQSEGGGHFTFGGIFFNKAARARSF